VGMGKGREGVTSRTNGVDPVRARGALLAWRATGLDRRDALAGSEY